mgnify:CR=1 FL=1
MLGSIRIQVDAAAVGRLLKSDEVRNFVMARTKRAADAAGPGFEAKVFYGFDRVSGIVSAETSEAVTALYDDSTVLTRALDAARD